ncbi:hypothetical protein MASR2M8_21060 [Opitutaceae bacterium]
MLSTTGGNTPRWKDDVEMKRMAEVGDAEACLEMGILVENGGENPPDYTEARLWYERAASKGMIEAEFRLGKLVSEGLGGSQNQETAFKHYMKAAEGGLALAQYNVGAMLASGRGTPRNYVEGLAWVIVASRDLSVDPEGEKRLREHLARRPADIAAAEKRAGELTAMLAERAAKAEAAKPAPAKK